MMRAFCMNHDVYVLPQVYDVAVETPLTLMGRSVFSAFFLCLLAVCMQILHVGGLLRIRRFFWWTGALAGNQAV